MPANTGWGARRSPFFALALFVALCGAGCSTGIHHGLTEAEANEIVNVLERFQVSAEKGPEGKGETWRVSVANKQVARALEILAAKNLPRPKARGFGDVFAGDSLIPSATEEKALYLEALQGELVRTIEGMSGVVAARVHIDLPQRDPLRDEQAPVPGAAVWVKAEGGSSVVRQKAELQELVAYAIGAKRSGLEHVSVTFDEIPPSAEEPNRADVLNTYGELEILRSNWKIGVLVIVSLGLNILLALAIAWVAKR